MRRVIFAIIGLLAGGPAALAQQTMNVAGTWQLNSQSSLYGINSTANGQLLQAGSSLSGTLTITGTPCASRSTFSGTLTGNRLSMDLNENGEIVSFTGTVTADGNSASGAYSAPSGGCTSGDRGTWSGLRLSVAKIPTVDAVTSAAFLAQPTRDGLATIFGANLSDRAYQAQSLPLPTQLGPTQVFLCFSAASNFSGCLKAPLLYASPTQISLYVPQDRRIAANDHSSLYVNVVFSGNANADAGNSSQAPFPFYQHWPSIFAEGYDCNSDPAAADNSPCGISATSRGPLQVQRGAIIDQQGQLITSQNPARIGQYYSMYLTGLGIDVGQNALDIVHTQALVAYSLLPGKSGPPYAGKMAAMPDWAGASSFVGLQQVNFKLPEALWEQGLPCGDQRFEIGIGFSIGPNADAHGFRFPVLIKNGEVPCGQ